MKKLVVTATFTLSLTTAAAWACEYPEKVAVPNGNSASEQEMLDGQRAVKTYMAAMQDYLDCIDAETDAESEETTDEQRAMLISKHNAAVDEMEQVAQAFNDEVRAFKAANK